MGLTFIKIEASASGNVLKAVTPGVQTLKRVIKIIY